jgi:phosphoribosylformylglycinamidine (FGAM) synthase PurS component
MFYKVAIANKPGFRDRHGEHVCSDISDIGLKGVHRVSYFPLFSFEGELTINEIDLIARSLLCDPVTQSYGINSSGPAVHKGKGSRYEIEIWFKPGVTDTVSQSVGKAVKDMGINKSMEVKTGHKYTFAGSLSKNNVQQAVERLLVNPLIQNYKISSGNCKK